MKEEEQSPFVFKRKKDELDELYLGETVSVLSQVGANIGTYVEGDDKSKIYLCPSIVYEPFYDERGEEIPNSRLEKKIPTIIETRAFITIQPVSQEFIDRLLKRNPQKILEAREKAKNESKEKFT